MAMTQAKREALYADCEMRLMEHGYDPNEKPTRQFACSHIYQLLAVCRELEVALTEHKEWLANVHSVAASYEDDIRGLQSENAAVCRELEGEVADVTLVARELAASLLNLDDANAALRADKERLDWLEQEQQDVRWRSSQIHGVLCDLGNGEHATLRAALDAARQP